MADAAIWIVVGVSGGLCVCCYWYLQAVVHFEDKERKRARSSQPPVIPQAPSYPQPVYYPPAPPAQYWQPAPHYGQRATPGYVPVIAVTIGEQQEMA
jgi:hypothetical protein